MDLWKKSLSVCYRQGATIKITFALTFILLHILHGFLRFGLHSLLLGTPLHPLLHAIIAPTTQGNAADQAATANHRRHNNYDKLHCFGLLVSLGVVERVWGRACRISAGAIASPRFVVGVFGVVATANLLVIPCVENYFVFLEAAQLVSVSIRERWA